MESAIREGAANVAIRESSGETGREKETDGERQASKGKILNYMYRQDALRLVVSH
jgi:hypothetical protein